MSLILGDNLEELKKIESNSINLIYLDPPFFTQKTHKLKDSNNKEYSFEDSWESIEEYMFFIEERLKECYRVLKEDGTLFLHCDKAASHYLRVVLDKVFGMNNFVNEIIWYYKRWSNSKKGLLNSHQNIYFYAKTKKFKFKKLFTEYSPTTNIDQILQNRVKNKEGKSIYQKDEYGEIVMNNNKQGVPLGDVWEIPFLNPRAKERCGYPTQKPILLLEKIIELVTDEGDLVLDPFCGSGTTLVAAKLLNRKYIGIDISKEAIELAKMRLEKPIKTSSQLLNLGKESYIEKSQKEIEILNILGAIPVQRNKGIDGFLKKEDTNGLISIKIQKSYESLEEALELLLKSSIKKKCEKMLLIKTNNSYKNVLFKEESSQYKDIIIIDSLELALEKKLNKKI